MNEIEIKPNLVIFEKYDIFEKGLKSIISINCSEILTLTQGYWFYNLLPNCVQITLKNKDSYFVIGEIRDLHSRILRS